MSDTIVVTVGPLTWELGLEFAITAVARARERGAAIAYEIAGEGPERERVLYTAFDLGLEDVVRIVSPARANPRPGIFLWPDLTRRRSPEAEAAAGAGIAVVSTVTGIGGRVVAPGDVDALASALVEVVCGSS